MPRLFICLAAMILLHLCCGAQANEFYRGKTLRLMVPAEIGGGYDSYARTFAQFFRRHMPGDPLVMVQNIPGGGGLTAANWLYNLAPRDGLTIGLMQRGVPFYPYFGDKSAQFVPTRFNWLGSFSAEAGVTYVWHTAKARVMVDAFKRPVLLGSSGPNDSETYPNLMNNTIGTRFRIVPGYKSNTDVMFAVERGELEGMTGSWSSLKAERPTWVRDGLVRFLVQIARVRQPDLPDVPLVMDFVTRDEDRSMWNVFLSMAQVGRPVAAPPDIPEQQLTTLRAAFAATMRDPAFVAEMKRAGRDLSPETGELMHQRLQEVSATSSVILTKVNGHLRRN
jgi:tripartite-type tricarboxylate transporter receptor subunit TctC